MSFYNSCRDAQKVSRAKSRDARERADQKKALYMDKRGDPLQTLYVHAMFVTYMREG